MAVNKNLDLKLARLDVGIALADLFSASGYYDPTFDSRLNYSSTGTEGTLSGTTVTLPGENTTHLGSGGFTGATPWGMRYDLGFDVFYDRRTDTTSGTDFDTYTVDTGLAITQPLLRNFWIDQGRMTIKFNRKGLRVADLALLGVVNAVVRDVKLNYYELMFARENIRVQEKNLEVADRFARENRKKVEVGTLAPLDAQQAEADRALAEATLLTAWQTLGGQENILKLLISDDIESWYRTRILPTENLVAVPESYNLPGSWVNALTLRPDFNQVKALVEQQGILVDFRYNQLFPQLDLVGSYGRRGIDSGTTNRSARFSPALEDIRDDNLPRYSFGIVFSIPLENKGPRGAYRASKQRFEQLQTQLKQLHQTILVEVEDAVAKSQVDFRNVDASRQKRIADEAAYDAELKRLEQGKSTSFLVLEIQRNLFQSRVDEIRALADYNKDRVNVQFLEGTILEKSGIKIK